MADAFSELILPSSFSKKQAILISTGAALLGSGLLRRQKSGLLLAGAGAGLLVFGAANRKYAQVQETGPLRRAVTIRKSADEVKRFLLDPHSLGAAVQPVIAVRQISEEQAEFRFHASAGDSLVRVSRELQEAGNSITWRTEAGSRLALRLAPGPNGSTEVHAELLRAPGSDLRTALLTVEGISPARVLREGLRHLKQLLETGEIPTTRGQVSGRRKWVDRTTARFLGETSRQPLAG